jgi:hypothetical protein
MTPFPTGDDVDDRYFTVPLLEGFPWFSNREGIMSFHPGGSFHYELKKSLIHNGWKVNMMA